MRKVLEVATVVSSLSCFFLASMALFWIVCVVVVVAVVLVVLVVVVSVDVVVAVFRIVHLHFSSLSVLRFLVQTKV